MKIGSIHMTTWDAARSQRQVYLDFVEAAAAAERLGYWSVWTTEHHMANDPGYLPYGVPDFDIRAYDLASDPLTLLSYVAAQTSRIRLGTGVLVLHYDHPIRVAERAAMLDTLSGGRLELGIGRGGSQGPREPIIFDVPRDQDRNRRKYHEALEIILRAWTGDPFSFDGEVFHIPEGIVVPSPVQRPRPPIYVGTSSPESVMWTARKGLGYASTAGAWGLARMDTHRSVHALYHRTAEEAGVDVSEVLCPHVLMMYCGESDAEAEETAEEYLMKFTEVIEAHSEGKRGGAASAPFETPEPTAQREGIRAIARHQIETNIIGGAETCRQKLQAFRDAIDLNYLLAFAGFGGMPRATMLPSMERFATQVMPLFADPGEYPTLPRVKQTVSA